MPKTEKISMNEKVYESLEEWKNDFLPNTVKNEHLLFAKKANDHKSSNNQRGNANDPVRLLNH
jgi:hypothetical protein